VRSLALAFVTLVVLILFPGGAAAQRAKLAREAAEMFAARGGSAAAKEVTHLASRIESIAARHGDDAILALRKGGPEAVHLVEAAGEHGGKAIRCLAAHGEAGAARVLSRPTAMKQFLAHGDDAAVALVKHPGVAEPLIERGGVHAVHALNAVGPQGGRRIAMLIEGELARHAARHPDVLGVVAKHGEKATEFIWKNRAVLAGGAALTAFLVHPEPFLSGTRDILAVAGDAAVKPAVGGFFNLLNTGLIALGVLILAAIGLAYKYGLPKGELVKAAVATVRPTSAGKGGER
jgi:hypothetical protein